MLKSPVTVLKGYAKSRSTRTSPATEFLTSGGVRVTVKGLRTTSPRPSHSFAMAPEPEAVFRPAVGRLHDAIKYVWSYTAARSSNTRRQSLREWTGAPMPYHYLSCVLYRKFRVTPSICRILSYIPLSRHDQNYCVPLRFWHPPRVKRNHPGYGWDWN